MPPSNLDRLIKLAEEVFAVKSDPDQLDVDDKVIERLKTIHPATVSEYRDENGPIAWLLLIPTTTGLMDRFLAKEITERQLFEETPVNAPYQAIYLCSALVLEEYRHKGIIKNMSLAAIEEIRRDHPVNSLFFWAFSKEGAAAAKRIAQISALPLFRRG